MVQMTVTLRDEGTGTAVSGVYRLDPTSGSTTLQASVWSALTALYQTLVTAAAGPQTLT